MKPVDSSEDFDHDEYLQNVNTGRLIPIPEEFSYCQSTTNIQTEHGNVK